MRAQRGALVCLGLSLAGLALCAYLEFLHLALLRGEFVGGAACSAAGTIFNCHAVTASPFGSVFGIPLALWGFLGYLASLSLALIAWQVPDSTSTALTCLVALGLGFVAVDLVLLVVMVTQIRYLCPLCLVTYLLNLALLLIAKASLGQPWRRIVQHVPAAAGLLFPKRHAAGAWLFWAVILTGVTGTWAVNAATRYVSQGAPGILRKQMAQFVKQQPPLTVETSGDPLLGLPDRPVQVVEFSDFLCPSCQKASKFTPIILAGHRQEVAFVFKHFPLDQSCNASISRTLHPTACQIAAAAECAHEQGKFWALHDRIFEQGSTYKAANLERDATELGLDVEAFRACLDSGRGLEAVKRDVAQAAQLGVSSTPTFLINGVPVSGVLTPTVFDEFVRALRQAGQAD